MSFKESAIGTIPNEWEIIRISEVSKVIDSLHQTPKYLTNGIPMVRVTDIKEDRLELANCLEVSNEDYELFTRNHKPTLGDIVISRVGTYGVFSYVNTSEKFCLGQNTAIISPTIYSKYLFYNLINKRTKYQIDNLAVGSTQKTISLKNIKAIQIPVCNDHEQKAIADILSCLDDKIELNNRINKTLEEMAQAIFKSWFVDFEPFRGGEFQETDLGSIPIGWRIATIGDVCQNVTDGVHNSVVDDPEGEYFLLSCKNIKGGTISIGSAERKIDEPTFQKLRKRTQLAKGDILLSSVGTIGEIALLTEEPKNIEFQRSVAMIKPNPKIVSSPFIYESLLAHKSEIKHAAHGAVQQCIFIGDIKRFTVIIPEYKLMMEYSDLVTPLFEHILANNKENFTLFSLRDILLPKLMSGEIRVPIEEVQ